MPEEQDSFFQSYFNAVPAPMAVLDMDFNFVRVNAAYTKIIGYRIEDVAGKSVFGVIHPDDVEENKILLGRLKSGEISSFTIEKKSLKKDGSVGWVRNSVTVVRDAQGAPVRVVTIIEDLGALRQTEQALQTVDRQFKQMLDFIPQMAYTARPDGEFDFFNKSWHEYTNSPYEFGVRNWGNLLHPEDRAAALANWDFSIKTGAPYQSEFRFEDRRRPGEYRWFLGRAEPLRDEAGRIVKWFGTNTDVDDLKRIEQTLRESEERFRRLAEETTIFVWTSNPLGLMDYINPGTPILSDTKRAWIFEGIYYPK